MPETSNNNVANFSGTNLGNQFGQVINYGTLSIGQQPQSDATHGGTQLGSLSRETRKQLLQWLSQVQYVQYHKTTLAAVLPGTGRWLLTSDVFHAWCRGNTPTIWLRGIPGSGKSTLMSTIIHALSSPEERRTLLNLDGDIAVIYFYCARDGSQGQVSSVDVVLRTLLHQLVIAASGTELPPEIVKTFTERDATNFIGGALNYKECVALISSIAERLQKIFVAVDGLDEYSDTFREGLLDALEEIISSAKENISVILASQETRDMILRMSDAPQIPLDEPSHSFDIHSYIRVQIERKIASGLLLGGEVSPKFRAEIENTLIEKSGGMFRWVQNSIQYLSGEQMEFEEDVRSALKRLPPGLNQSYDLLYERVEKLETPKRDLVQRSFCWLLQCTEPLDEQQMLAAIAVSGDACLSVSIRNLLSLCQRLVVIDRHSKLVRFAHASVRDYLRTKASFGQCLAHVIVAERCLDCLMNQRSNKVTVQNSNTALYRYASLYWGHHCACSKIGRSPNGIKGLDGETRAMLAPKLLGFLATQQGGSASFRETIREIQSFLDYEFIPSMTDRQKIQVVRSNARSSLWKLDEDSSSLFAACAWGITEALNWPSKLTSLNIHRLNNKEQSCLELAAINGNVPTVKRLVELGVDINKGYYPPLFHVAAQGNVAMLEHIYSSRLFKLNIDARAVDTGLTALMQAIGALHIDMTRRLIEIGADVTICDELGQDALHKAVNANFFEAVQLILDKHSDPNRLDKANGMNPLHISIERGYHVITSGLIQCEKIRINCQTRNSKKPIELAVAMESYEDVQALLNARPESVIPNEQELWRILFIAASMPHSEIVQLLIKQWRRNNEPKNTIKPFLIPRALYHHMYHHGPLLQLSGPTQLLHTNVGLLRWFDSEELDSLKIPEHGSPLCPVILAAQQQALDEILGQNSGCDAVDAFERTSLWLWISMGHTSRAARLISDDNVDINRADSVWGMTPLHLAIIQDQKEIAYMLMERSDIDFSVLDFEQRNVLHLACMLGRRLIAQKLVASGKVPLNSVDLKALRTPLAWACCHSNTNIDFLDSLQFPGAWRQSDVLGKIPLMLAIEHGNAPLAKAIMSAKPIDANATDYQGMAAWDYALLHCSEAGLEMLAASFVHTSEESEQHKFRPSSTMENNVYAWKDLGNKILISICKGQDPSRNMSPTLIADESGMDLLPAVVKWDPSILVMKNIDGRTPISLAAETGQLVVVKELVRLAREYGHELGITDHLDLVGRPPLFWAAEFGRTDVCAFLYDVNPAVALIEDFLGRTLLMMAAKGGHRETTEYVLCMPGMKLEARDHQRKTAVDTALDSDGYFTASVITRQMKQLGYEQPISMFLNNEQTRILHTGRNLTGWIDTDSQRTRLSFAAEDGDIYRVRRIIQSTSSAAALETAENYKDINGRSPVWYAIQAGMKLVIFEFLACRRLGENDWHLLCKDLPEWIIEHRLLSKCIPLLLHPIHPPGKTGARISKNLTGSNETKWPRPWTRRCHDNLQKYCRNLYKTYME